MSFSVIPGDKFKKEEKVKSDGNRIFTHVVRDNKEVYLLTLYYKSEFNIIDDKMLKNITISGRCT